MRRREVIGFAGTTLLAWPLIARAQQQAKTVRVGVLGFGARPPATRIEALRAGLGDLGYVEGRISSSSSAGRVRPSRCTKRPPNWSA